MPTKPTQPTHRASSDAELLPFAERLLEGVEGVRALRPPPALDAREETALRDAILLSLRTKILPELNAPAALPIFVGVQGGTNVGKSTIFNALSGQLLSPAVVQASATKHPLVFAHERWRRALLDRNPFPGLDCRELEDPKELLADAERTELLYLRFHSDAELEEWAFIDSPDFDGSLETNLEVARRVTVLSDITVFVATAQKYKDRDLIRHLRLLAELKAAVILVFNMVDEEIVFRTLVGDLRSEVAFPEEDLLAVRLPRSSSGHPEDELRDLVARPVLEHLAGRSAEEIKPLLVERTLSRSVEQAARLVHLFSTEVELKDRILRQLRDATERSVEAYERGFDLALPEETLAARRLLRETELWPRLELAADVLRSHRALHALSGLLRRTSDFVRRLLLRLSPRSEGAVEETPAAVAEYAAARNDTDFERVSRLAHLLRQEAETLFRDAETTSPLAREVVADFFSTSQTRAFEACLRDAFDREMATRRAAAGEDVLENVERWLATHPSGRRAFAAGSILFKLGAGALLAWLVPPEGVLEFLNWALFAGGYLLGAYTLALAITFAVRRKGRFRLARLGAFRTILEATLEKPLRTVVEDVLREDRLAHIRATAERFRERAASLRPPSPRAEGDPRDETLLPIREPPV